jgi:hypothetical protein
VQHNKAVSGIPSLMAISIREIIPAMDPRANR